MSGHKVVRRNREATHRRIYEDYFSDDPTYASEFFRRRFVLTRLVLLTSYHTLYNINIILLYNVQIQNESSSILTHNACGRTT